MCITRVVFPNKANMGDKSRSNFVEKRDLPNVCVKWLVTIIQILGAFESGSVLKLWENGKSVKLETETGYTGFNSHISTNMLI